MGDLSTFFLLSTDGRALLVFLGIQTNVCDRHSCDLMELPQLRTRADGQNNTAGTSTQTAELSPFMEDI